jgi:hypothetical protein
MAGDAYFGVSEWRPTKNTGGAKTSPCTPQAKRLDGKNLPAGSTSGWRRSFWSGEIKTRYKTSAPTVRLYGETPGSFPAHNWNLAEGRLLLDADVDGARNVCVLGSGLATNIFPNSSALGEQVKMDGINYTVVGVLEAKAARSAATRIILSSCR